MSFLKATLTRILCDTTLLPAYLQHFWIAFMFIKMVFRLDLAER